MRTLHQIADEMDTFAAVAEGMYETLYLGKIADELRLMADADQQRQSVSREVLREALQSSAEGPAGIDGYSLSEVARALHRLGIEVTP